MKNLEDQYYSHVDRQKVNAHFGEYLKHRYGKEKRPREIDYAAESFEQEEQEMVEEVKERKEVRFGGVEERKVSPIKSSTPHYL